MKVNLEVLCNVLRDELIQANDKIMSFKALYLESNAKVIELEEKLKQHEDVENL